MDLKMRDEALEQIRTNPEATIILVSLMAGGAGKVFFHVLKHLTLFEGSILLPVITSSLWIPGGTQLSRYVT